MDNFVEQFDKVVKQVESKKEESVRLQERLKSTTEEVEKAKAKLTELGIKDIDNVENELALLETEINEDLESCKNLLK